MARKYQYQSEDERERARRDAEEIRQAKLNRILNNRPGLDGWKRAQEQDELARRQTTPVATGA